MLSISVEKLPPVSIQKFPHILMAALLLSCSNAIAEDKLVVYTVNYPLQYFAQRVAGEQAEVILPMPADIDPVFWQPAAKDIVGFQQADIILLNGAGYAK